MTITTIGLDLAKSVLQAHGIDELCTTALVKKLHRKQMLPFFSKLPPCLMLTASLSRISGSDQKARSAGARHASSSTKPGAPPTVEPDCQLEGKSTTPVRLREQVGSVRHQPRSSQCRIWTRPSVHFAFVEP